MPLLLIIADGRRYDTPIRHFLTPLIVFIDVLFTLLLMPRFMPLRLISNAKRRLRPYAALMAPLLL